MNRRDRIMMTLDLKAMGGRIGKRAMGRHREAGAGMRAGQDNLRHARGALDGARGEMSRHRNNDKASDAADGITAAQGSANEARGEIARNRAKRRSNIEDLQALNQIRRAYKRGGVGGAISRMFR